MGFAVRVSGFRFRGLGSRIRGAQERGIRVERAGNNGRETRLVNMAQRPAQRQRSRGT